GEGDQHLAAGLEVVLVALGRVEQRGCVEVAVVMRDELRNRPLLGGELGVDVFGAFGLAFGFHVRVLENGNSPRANPSPASRPPNFAPGPAKPPAGLFLPSSFSFLIPLPFGTVTQRTPRRHRDHGARAHSRGQNEDLAEKWRQKNNRSPKNTSPASSHFSAPHLSDLRPVASPFSSATSV